MKLGASLTILACVGLWFTAGCDKEESLPEPIATGAEKKKDTSSEETGEELPPPGPAPASSCSPKAGEACFVGAELEHAAVLLHHLTGASVVVAGSYDKRIDGVIPTASAGAAFAALAKQAELGYRELAGVHYLGAAEALDRGAGAGDFCREPKSLVTQRIRVEELTKQVVEENGRRLVGSVDGDATVALANASPCSVVLRLIAMGGGQARIEAKALRITGDAALAKSTRAAGTMCAPLDSKEALRLPCHKTSDLAVVGAGMVGDAPMAIVRRIGRVYEPGEIVKPGELVGDYHTKIKTVDATGLIAEKSGNTIVSWSP